MAADAGKTNGHLGSLKDFFVLLREAFLTLVIGYCVFNPAVLGRYVCSSGVSELGFLSVSAKASCKIEEENSKERGKDQAEVAAAPVPASVVQAVAQAEAAAPDTAVRSGWVFLGRISEDEKQWVPGQPTTIKPVDVSGLGGATVEIRDDAYIREDVPAGERSSGRIISVARVGQRFQVERVDKAHAKGGGFFLWARVHQIPSAA